MLKIIYCLNVLAAVAGASTPGKESSEEEFKTAFAILKNGVPICGGLLLGNDGRFIVTAAHCVYGFPKSLLSVRAGSDMETLETVKRVIVHPYYMPPSADYDIALLRRNAVGNENAKGYLPIKVPPPSNATLKALSWNLKESKSKPKMAEGTLEDRKSCGAKLSKHIAVSTRMLCANIQSDFVVDGSPLIVNEEVAGIGSFYVDGGKEEMPKVFTNIVNSEIYSFVERYID